MLLVLTRILYFGDRTIRHQFTVSGILTVRLLLLLALAARSPAEWRSLEGAESGDSTQGCESRELNADGPLPASSAADRIPVRSSPFA